MGKPLSTINTGKPGRPANVRIRTRKVIAAALFESLNNCELIACAVPDSAIRKFCRELAAEVFDEINLADLRVIPAVACREMALLTGEVPHASESLAPVVGATVATTETTV